MCVGQRIRQYAEGCGISLSDISGRTVIPLARLQSFLEGTRHMTFEEYEQICGALGVGMDKFIFPRRSEAVARIVSETVGGQAFDEAEEN